MKLKSTREAYGSALVELGDDDSIVVLDADLSASTQTNKFAEKCPQRFFNVGCAEQNLIGVGAGLSISGKTSFVSTYAIFSGRAWEQIRNTVAHDNLNVKIAVSHAGLTNGADGASHQALEDIAIMRVIPNMTVIVPADAVEAREAIMSEADRKGPAYIRLNRVKTPIIFDEGYRFMYGRSVLLNEGTDLAIIATGTMVFEALEAARMLKEEGVGACVLNVHTIKPIDKDSIIKVARETGAIVTAEEHSIHGGLGGAVAEILAENYPVPMKIIGVNDQFGESGEYQELLKKHGLTATNISDSAKKLLEMRG